MASLSLDVASPNLEPFCSAVLNFEYSQEVFFYAVGLCVETVEPCGRVLLRPWARVPSVTAFLRTFAAGGREEEEKKHILEFGRHVRRRRLTTASPQGQEQASAVVDEAATKAEFVAWVRRLAGVEWRPPFDDEAVKAPEFQAYLRRMLRTCFPGESRGPNAFFLRLCLRDLAAVKSSAAPGDPLENVLRQMFVES